MPGFLGCGWFLCMARFLGSAGFAVAWRELWCGAACVGCEYEKGIWWMPWHQEAMKDVARCENLGGAASGR